MSKHQGAQSARSSHQLETRSTQTRSAGSEISSAFCEGVFLRGLTVTAVCILKKTNAWLSRVELFCCNCTLCKCDVASASANRVKHVSYLWMQFAEASFKNWGLFWSVFSAYCGKWSPTQSTEEQGGWTDCFPAFFCRKGGAHAFFSAQNIANFKEWNLPSGPKSLLFKASLFFTCAAGHCCPPCLGSCHSPLSLAGWESSSTKEQLRRWIWAAQCLQMIFFDERKKKYLMLALLSPFSHSDNHWGK